jgi:hypothetical protein
MESNIPIPDNRDPRRGDRVKAEDIASIHDSIRRLRNRVKTVTLPALPIIEAPFIPSLRIKDGTTDEYQISVSRGLVVEKVATAGDGVDALIFWEPSNALTDDVPTWFDIAHNESIFAVVTETNSGTVRSIFSVELEILSSSTISTAYIPGVQAGYYVYELAKLTIVDSKPILERFTSGSHIFHEVTTTGIYGTYTWTFLDEVTGSESNEMSMEFANGILVASTVTVSGFQTGSGTLADPYVTQFNARDTDT